MLVLCAVAMFAQSDSGLLFGVVTDPSGRAIIGANISLRNQATGAERKYVTDERGLFYFTVLPSGRYHIDLESPGFKHYQDADVRVQVAQVARLDIQMEIGSVKETVNIAESPSGLNSETVSQGTVVGSEKIPVLPLNGRQFIQLALLVPGANPGGRAVQQNSVRQGQTGGLSIAGNRTNNTAFLLDGAVNTDPDFNSLNYSPSIDGIAEFQVQTAMVSAEYGRASVNVVTKSGSNDLHGSVFEFLRNRNFDARPFNLSGSLPKFQRNQFGGTLGGPIKKDKLFAFFSYEGLRVRQAGAGLTSVVVPSVEQRDGDFNKTFPKGITDPDNMVGGVAQKFPGNRVPASRLNPLSLAALKAIPLPTDALTNFYQNATGVLSQNNNNYSGRFDYTAKENWTLFGRYSIAEESANIPATVTGRDRVNDARSQNAVIGSTYVVTSGLLNETRVSYGRLAILSGLPELNFSLGSGSTTLPLFILQPYPNMGGSGGFNATRGSGIINVRDNSYQVYDNVSWRKGRHGLKFGGEIYRPEMNRIESTSAIGEFQFTTAYTGDPLASFLLGLPAIASRAVGPSRIDGRQLAYSLYAQDDFRVSSKVTVNLGLRYELAAPMYDAHQQMSSIDYSNVPSPQTIFAQGRTGFYSPTLFICGQNGTPRGCAYTDKNNFAPRAGIVWAADSKTVLRAGAGMFYASNDADPLFRLAAGLPGNLAQTLNSDPVTPRFRGFDVFGPAVVGPVQIQAAGIDINQRTSYSVQWNATAQRQITKDIVLEVGYLASLGLKLEQNVQPNNAMPGAGAIDPRRPYASLTYAPGTVFPNYINVVGNSVPVGFINYLPHSAQSNYHAMLARVEKRFTTGLSFLSSYTFSKAITNAPQFRNAGGVDGNENSPAQDAFNLRADRGLASFNVAHRSVTSFLYDLPFGHNQKFLTEGLASKLLGGFQISGIYSMQTGFPFTVNLTGDTAGVGAGTGGIFVRPNAVPGQTADLPGSERSTSRYFNTSAFSLPPNFTFGNVGKNTVTGPGLTNLDLVVSKETRIGENLRFQIRVEAFNIANHSNYNGVGRIINTPATYGKVLNQLDPRQIQLGAKILF
ncbi:MAG TPA: TonB-dependent receptor [Bryobacteraceae bacterium]|nr:TonB-dependent receptor [Bryobacteraceae bacterium]